MSSAALQELLRGHKVHRPRLPRALPPPLWGLGELAGRLVELSAPPDGASARLTAAVALVLEAQRQGEPVAWIAADQGSFYPPDLDASGVDLAALAVIRVATRAVPRAPRGALRDETAARRQALSAADRLLRSGAFGLVVLELGALRELPLAAQTRLAGLAQRHDSALLCLTSRAAEPGSLGSLISLHASATRRPMADGRFCCELTVLKDKRRGPGWRERAEGYRGPPGLR